MSLAIILWKELVDLSRDRKTLAAVVLLPLIGLPGVAVLSGVLATTQTVRVAIIVEDSNSTGFARLLAEKLSASIEASGSKAVVNVIEGGVGVPQGAYDLVVFIPQGFWGNLTSIRGVAVLKASAGLGAAGSTALNALYSVVGEVSREVAYQRIEVIASRAGLHVEPERIMYPIRVAVGYHSASGAPAPPSRAEEAQTARLLEFAFLFVVDPALIYMADSIVGEKERRTIERLLLSPLSRRDILAGKALASLLLGVTASVVDVASLLVFFELGGAPISLSPGLLVVWLTASTLVILFTAFVVGAISARSASVRAAQNASFIVLTVAITIYFSALLVDLSNVSPFAAVLLQAIPYTHAALAVGAYAVGNPLSSLVHITVLAAFTLAGLIVAERAFSAESLVAYKD